MRYTAGFSEMGERREKWHKQEKKEVVTEQTHGSADRDHAHARCHSRDGCMSFMDQITSRKNEGSKLCQKQRTGSGSGSEGNEAVEDRSFEENLWDEISEKR